MPPVASLKSEILDVVERALPETGLSEEDFNRLERLAALISERSVYPEPIRTPERVEGRWETLFAHFGVRHSAGKPRVHLSTLKQQSFNRFPALPIRVTRILQEVAVEGQAYNNVIEIATPDGAATGYMVVRGRYSEHADGDPRRFGVEFYQVEIHPGPGVSDDALRSALGLKPAADLIRPLKAAKLHSDVIYLDDEIRINRGGLGGLYVLRRLSEPGVSIALTSAR